jgi:hypothetical protein
LSPPFEWLAAQVVPIQLDDVEGVHEDAVVVAPIAYALEQRDAVFPAGDCLAIEDARPGSQAREGLHDHREAVREVVAGAAVQLDPLVVLAGITRMPSCLISWSHSVPEGALGAAVGRQGGMKPVGRALGRNDHMSGGRSLQSWYASM